MVSLSKEVIFSRNPNEMRSKPFNNKVISGRRNNKLKIVGDRNQLDMFKENEKGQLNAYE
jgi:hypothetical protein